MAAGLDKPGEIENFVNRLDAVDAVGCEDWEKAWFVQGESVLLDR